MYSVIHPTTPEQLEKIFTLRYDILRAPWQQARGSERDDHEGTSIQAMIEGEDGSCIATGRLQFNSDTEGQIRFMAVSEYHRGKKLGQLILKFLEEQAIKNKRRTIVLQARENAVKFYESNGYRVEEKTFLLFDSIQHYRMSKKLL